jgi:nickel-dependent lactate racemase
MIVATLQSSTVSKAQLMRTGVWYGDQALDLEFPRNWEVTILWPDTPPELTESQIVDALEHPTGRPPLRDMCQGAKRPLVIIDDVNRPTPVASVLPAVLRHFRDAGISARDVAILLATGTHAPPKMNSVRNKVGPEVASACKILVHNADQSLAYLGKTRFGTPVLVNKEVTASDFVIGIGGVYPNYTAGYGGGSKLALGVLGFRSILSLHYSHRSIGRGLCTDRDTFRADLNEIADMMRIRSMISVQVNADRKPIRIRCGDYLSYYQDEATFARRTYTAPPPGDADVVISNAYPTDLSLTFALMKGAAPLHQCRAESSRILLASCSEGLGGHGLFPVVNVPKLHRYKTYLRFASIRPLVFARKIPSALSTRIGISNENARTIPIRVWKNPVWLYAGTNSAGALPPQAPGVRITKSWSEIVQAIGREQDIARRLKVLVYPCAPLLCLSAAERPASRVPTRKST